MRDVSDLPLFSWRQVICFPIARQASKVRDAAEEILSASEHDGDVYRKVVTLGIHRRMSGQGFSEAAIEHEVATFWQAVHSEMVRMTYGERQSPDGAA